MLQFFIYRQFKFSQFRYYCKRRNINYYEVLQVSPTSSQKEIRAAFIKLSKTKHPDISGSKNHEEFARINEAYNVLSKAHSRTQYDNNIINNNIYSNNVSRRMNNPYYTTNYWSDHRSRRPHQTHSYWGDEYEYEYRDNRTEEEKNRSYVKRAGMIAIFLVSTVVIFTTQIFMVNRSVTKQREELKNYMTTLRQRREEAFKPENQENYENYVRQELMMVPETSMQKQQNEALSEKAVKE